MAKTSYTFAKRQRDLAKQQKKEEKRQRKADAKAQAEAPAEGEGEAASEDVPAPPGGESSDL